jgi:hypothetical protein
MGSIPGSYMRVPNASNCKKVNALSTSGQDSMLGCGLGHVWGEIRNGMLLGNPARGRPMLFASDELTAMP